MVNTHSADVDVSFPHEQLTDIEFLDMEPLDDDCDIVGVSPLEAVAIIPGAGDIAVGPFSGPVRAPEDLPTEEYAAWEVSH